MRTFLLVVIATCTVSAAAQPTPTPAETTKYWIFFEATEELARGAELARIQVAPRASERRRLRGTAHLPARADLRVAPPHVEALRALGVEVIVESRWFNAASAYLTEAQRAAVGDLPGVRALRTVARLTTERSVSTAPRSSVEIDFGPSALQIDLVNARIPLENGIDGDGVIIGFLDTTYDFDHPALAHVTVLGEDDFTGQTQGNTHGLSVASVAVGYDEGELVGPGWNAAVLAATTEYAPTETRQEEDYFVAGMEWLEASGADVVNVSLGYSVFDPGEGDYTYADMDGNTTLVTRAADFAASLGVAVVTSAGNEGNSSWTYITAPADADSVITVGAVRADSTRAGFSSFGPTSDGRTKPDVVALGVDVWIARPDGAYGFGSGTSFSAPAVSGVVAQILQANPSLDPIAVRTLLRETASQSETPDNARGWGVVNAAAAVQRAYALANEEPGEIPAVEASLYPTLLRRGTPVTLAFNDSAPSTYTVLRLYDVLGRRVATLYEGPARGAPLQLALPALPAGVYVYRITSDDGTTSGRLVLL